MAISYSNNWINYFVFILKQGSFNILSKLQTIEI